MQLGSPRSLLAATLLALTACTDPTVPSPGSPGALPLGEWSRTTFMDELEPFDSAFWTPREHRLGRSVLRASNVRPHLDGVSLILPAGSYDGGEIRSRDRFRYGSFEARLRAPMAPGSVTGFFLYEGVEPGDEIDIELYNDGSRRVMFTVWVDGRQVHNATRQLPFDPAAGYHTYRIRWGTSGISFLVDGVPMDRWAGELPHDPMYLMVNAWWPRWLTGPLPSAEARLDLDRIAVTPR